MRKTTEYDPMYGLSGSRLKYMAPILLLMLALLRVFLLA